jgi:hypothetical protein
MSSGIRATAPGGFVAAPDQGQAFWRARLNGRSGCCPPWRWQGAGGDLVAQVGRDLPVLGLGHLNLLAGVDRSLARVDSSSHICHWYDLADKDDRIV